MLKMNFLYPTTYSVHNNAMSDWALIYTHRLLVFFMHNRSHLVQNYYELGWKVQRIIVTLQKK